MAHVAPHPIQRSRVGFGDRATAFLFRRVSKHAQRVFFLASLGGQFNHYATHRHMAMEKLNEAMALSYRQDAMKLPIYLAARVWGRTKLKEVLTEEAIDQAQNEDDLRELAGRVVDAALVNYHYAPRDEMIVDVMELLGHHCHHLQQEGVCPVHAVDHTATMGETVHRHD